MLMIWSFLVFVEHQLLLRTCSQNGQEYDIMFNALKSNMIIKTKGDWKLVPPDFSLSRVCLKVCCW